MNAKQFNALYPVGSHFVYQPNRVLRGGRIVRTVAAANDCRSGCVVEINVEPYFAKTETLTPAR